MSNINTQKIDVPYSVEGNLILYIERHFRTIADKDYISARSNFSLGLPIQFLWAAQQAIEKYLKAITLFHYRSVKDINHDLLKALQRAEQCLGFKFILKEDDANFFDYLNLVSNNRYLQKGYCIKPDHIHQVDRLIWSIRKFCQPLQLTEGCDPQLNEEDYKSKIERMKGTTYCNNIEKLKIPRGYLEELILNPNINRAQRKVLLLNNKVYCSELECESTIWPDSIHAGNVELDDDLLKILENLIKLNH